MPNGETVSAAEVGELGYNPEYAEANRPFRRCKHCLGTIPAPRRRYCSAFCAERGKLKLQDWRRRRARAR